jgi:sulfite exporter TauE/SafE
MSELIAPFFIGLMGSLHCLGMCGPLIMAYSLHIRAEDSTRPMAIKAIWARGFFHHLAFHGGRIITYSLLGGLAATLAHITSFNQVMGNLRGGFTLGAGIVMIFLGMVLLKVLPFPLLSLPSFGSGSFWGRIFPSLFRSQSLSAKVLLGMSAGFLPCMLSWAMIVKAATASHPLTGFLTMAFFGAGTIPALFFTGLPASLLSLRARFLGERMAAASVIFMGLILILKGTRYFV